MRPVSFKVDARVTHAQVHPLLDLALDYFRESVILSINEDERKVTIYPWSRGQGVAKVAKADAISQIARLPNRWQPAAEKPAKGSWAVGWVLRARYDVVTLRLEWVRWGKGR